MRYRKKPVVIEAWQFNPHDFNINTPDWVNLAAWCHEKVIDTGRDPERFRRGDLILIIPNEHGPVEAKAGDWVIKGVNGEVYPCTNDVFWKTYEPVEE